MSSLTVAPGAIVKLGPAPISTCTRRLAQRGRHPRRFPIVFTSIKDDAHGGIGRRRRHQRLENDWGCQGSCGDLNIRDGDGRCSPRARPLR